MAGIYTKGEEKIRPGIYFRTESTGGVELAPVRNGVVAVAFKGNWGPLGEVKTLESADDIDKMYGESGDGANLDALKFALQGGATKIKAVRVGSGGTCASITLKDTTATAVDVVKFTANYAGTRPLSVTIRDSVADPNVRECMVYSGTTLLDRFAFAKGPGEVAALVKAVAGNSQSVITATKLVDGNGTMAAVNQAAFTTPGASPDITNADYSAAFTLLEAENFNVLCVDSTDPAIHALVKAFIIRVNAAGLLAMAVVGDPISTEYATRKAHLATFDTENVVYCLNGGYETSGAITVVDGYRIAAAVAGLIAAVPCNDSVTHKTIPGIGSVAGALTNTQIEDCLESGALVLTPNSAGRAWIEQGVNTLATLGSNQDAGWKKIRRVKTRYELITRVNAAAERVIGSVNNDKNGRATIIALANGVLNAMVSEGKLVSGTSYEDPNAVASGDSAWFVIEALDMDSIEKVYITYRFAFTA
ncbi:MAG: phage tail sheath subtilisin-like domain-containing protein [Clostridia bacterium]